MTELEINVAIEEVCGVKWWNVKHWCMNPSCITNKFGSYPFGQATIAILKEKLWLQPLADGTKLS